jgi:hypothetical protein
MLSSRPMLGFRIVSENPEMRAGFGSSSGEWVIANPGRKERPKEGEIKQRKKKKGKEEENGKVKKKENR